MVVCSKVVTSGAIAVIYVTLRYRSIRVGNFPHTDQAMLSAAEEKRAEADKMAE